MTHSGYFLATFQYQLLDGAIADAWLTAWVANNQSVIDNNPANGHTLSALIPPHSEGCVTQIQAEYHLVCADVNEYNDLLNEVSAAIWDGGVATADCSSSWAQSRPE